MLSKNKLTAIIAAIALSASILSPTSTTYATEVTAKTIDILSINDFHGAVEELGKNVGAAKLTGQINKFKALENENYGVIPVSAGDSYQGSAMSNLTQGAPVNDMFKAMGIKISAVGNHEFDWNRSNFNTWKDQGQFEFLAANIVNKSDRKIVDFAIPYKMVEKNGVKIAFIGITTQETLTATKADKIADLDFLDPVETLDTWSKVVRAEGANVVVALTHTGALQVDNATNINGLITGEAAEIAKNAKDVDVILGGHEHNFVSGYVNGRPIVIGGKNGTGLATVKLTFDNNNKLIAAAPKTEIFKGKEKDMPKDLNMETIINNYKIKLDPIMSEKVTILENDLGHDKNSGLTPLGVTVSEAMRKIAKTQISINNGGGVRAPLTAGQITVGSMYNILPFDNTIITLDMLGSDLVKNIEHGIKPTGGIGWGQYAGIKVWYDNTTNKVTSIRLEDGTKVEMDKYYSVAINDFMVTGGDGYDFKNAKNINNTQLVMRDEIQNYWKANGMKISDYNLLIAGADTTVVPPVKPVEPSVPVTPVAPVAPVAPVTPKEEEITTPGKGTLPYTGGVDTNILITLAIGLIGSGILLAKKKKSA